MTHIFGIVWVFIKKTLVDVSKIKKSLKKVVIYKDNMATVLDLSNLRSRVFFGIYFYKHGTNLQKISFPRINSEDVFLAKLSSFIIKSHHA